MLWACNVRPYQKWSKGSFGENDAPVYKLIDCSSINEVPFLNQGDSEPFLETVFLLTIFLLTQLSSLSAKYRPAFPEHAISDRFQVKIYTTSLEKQGSVGSVAIKV